MGKKIEDIGGLHAIAHQLAQDRHTASKVLTVAEGISDARDNITSAAMGLDLLAESLPAGLELSAKQSRALNGLLSGIAGQLLAQAKTLNVAIGPMPGGAHKTGSGD